MKKSFAIYGDEVFSMDEKVSNKFETLRSTRQGVNLQTSCNSARLDIDLGIINDKNETNKETADKALELLKVNRVTDIRTLVPVFQVAIAYKIIGMNNRRILDQGVLVRTLTNFASQNKFYILGVDNKNEMYHKLVKELKATFELRFSHSYPCGITGKPEMDWMVYIENVTITQIIDYKNENDFELGDDGNFGCHCNMRYPQFHRLSEGVSLSRDAYVRRKENIVAKNIVVFDSTYDGITIHPINVKSMLREFTIDLTLVLDNYFIMYDDSSILDIIYENKKIKEEEENPEIPSEDPENPDDKKEDDPDYPGFDHNTDPEKPEGGDTPGTNPGGDGETPGTTETPEGGDNTGTTPGGEGDVSGNTETNPGDTKEENV